MRKLRLIKQTKKADRKLLILTIVLTFIGIVAVADASAPLALREFSDKYFFAKQQALSAFVGIIILAIVSKLKYSFWKLIAMPFFMVAVALLVLVYIPGIGLELLGAKRWISIGPVNFQPSEFVKLSLAVYFAKLASAEKKLMAYIIPLGVTSLLVVFEPDLGTAMVILAIGLSQIFVSGVNLFHFFAILAIGAVASLGFIMTSGYRKERLMTFLQQTQDPLGKAYHIRQILLALGAGGFWGVGLGQSRQKYLFLPETATDSIFAIIAEEVGFLGATAIVILFIFFIFQGIKIAKNAPDRFSYILSVGIIAWIGGQAFLNIASMVAIVPLTGIPLPFLSYGGSSLITILAACGILLNISRHAPKTKKV
jgi:cell division protein FtsW